MSWAIDTCRFILSFSQFDLSDLHRWIDQYGQLLIHVNRPMFPSNDLQLKLKAHCQAKFDLYKKVSQEFLRKSQTKHVSFDGFINSNNNNSSRINTSSSSSSSTPQQYSTDSQHHLSQARSSMNKYRRTETRNTSDETSRKSLTDLLISIVEILFLDRASNQQSSTSSYISDDCKVLYIETVIEVAKPVFYERNTDTLTTSNTEYHQQQRHVPVSTGGSERNVSHLYTSNEQRHESSDDEYNKPVNSPHPVDCITISKWIVALNMIKHLHQPHRPRHRRCSINKRSTHLSWVKNGCTFHRPPLSTRTWINPRLFVVVVCTHWMTYVTHYPSLPSRRDLISIPIGIVSNKHGSVAFYLGS